MLEVAKYIAIEIKIKRKVDFKKISIGKKNKPIVESVKTIAIRGFTLKKIMLYFRMKKNILNTKKEARTTRKVIKSPTII